ncbi:IucA/IucC family C-terminal-domain containing protein [Acidovorax sp. SDU_ACID1]|uniref:IucA/IucC family C-terminal-domain containing protein n=1 Tax=Acidovorax sp. SDU_ACID1 TaxID=3136632 RepID=UPI003872B793
MFPVWSNHYLAAVLPPFVAATMLLHQVFPLALDPSWLVLDEHGRPACVYHRAPVRTGSRVGDCRRCQRLRVLQRTICNRECTERFPARSVVFTLRIL